MFLYKFLRMFLYIVSECSYTRVSECFNTSGIFCNSKPFITYVYAENAVEDKEKHSLKKVQATYLWEYFEQ